MLRGITVVIREQAAETFAALDLTCDFADLSARFDQLIVESLVIPLGMVVSNVFFQGSFK